jgi:RimJ/RimL family protein N-acetyltransferase
MAPPPGRRRPDNPYQVRTPVPPLPLLVLPEPYRMRFASAYADAEMICEWMNRPHLAGTWRPANSLAWWRRHLSNQAEGWYSRPYVVSFEGQDFAYIELFRAAQDVIGTVYDADPYDVGLHGAIADPAMIKKGHGTAVFLNTVSGVFSVEPQCRRVMGDIPVVGSVRRFNEQTGGVFIGEAYIAHLDRPRALFSWPRSPEDTPRLREAMPESNPGT